MTVETPGGSNLHAVNRTRDAKHRETRDEFVDDRDAISAWVIAVSLFFCLAAYSAIHGILS